MSMKALEEKSDKFFTSHLQSYLNNFYNYFIFLALSEVCQAKVRLLSRYTNSVEFSVAA